MKPYDIERINRDIEYYNQLREDLKIEVSKRPAHYARQAGVSRQLINYFLHGKRGLSTKNVLKLYECVTNDTGK